VYFLLNGSECDSFNDNVSLLTYGDDNIMSVSKSADWFNHTAIAYAFNEMGIEYTMADKEAESVPFIDIKDASFLKRTWRFDEDQGCFMPPLDHDSIEKMLMVWTRSKSIPNEAQCIAVIGTAVREYFFYGKTVFEEKRALLQNLVERMNLENWVENSTFPTYDDLVKQFWDSSKHVVISDVDIQSTPDFWELVEIDTTETQITLQSDCVQWTIEEYDIFMYPTYQSCTNYDLSVHTWMEWSQLFNTIMQTFVFNALFTWEINQIWKIIVPTRISFIMSSWEMASRCNCRLRFIMYYFASWCIAQITHP
jgi:hypothetical protein